MLITEKKKPYIKNQVTELLIQVCKVEFMTLLIQLAVIQMKDAQKDHVEIYENIGTYLIIIINGGLFVRVLNMLFPYIDYGLRNNILYIKLRHCVPFLEK